MINFLLKDARKGGSVEFNTGTYRAGDGDSYTIAGNVGLPLGETGFANLSLEYGNSDPTNRSVQRADAAALIAAGNTAVADPAQILGAIRPSRTRSSSSATSATCSPTACSSTATPTTPRKR